MKGYLYKNIVLTDKFSETLKYAYSQVVLLTHSFNLFPTETLLIGHYFIITFTHVIPISFSLKFGFYF